MPIAIIIGYWLKRNQSAVENEALLQENWLWAWIVQYEIRIIKGMTNPREDEAVINYLNNILTRTKRDHLLKSASQDRDSLKEKKVMNDYCFIIPLPNNLLQFIQIL